MLKHQKIGNDIMITLSGEIDLSTSMLIKNDIDSIIDHDDAKRVIFDLTQVSFIDSSGLGMIIGRHKKMLSRGGQVSLFQPNNNVLKAILSCGLDKVMDVYAGEEEVSS